MSLPCIYVPFCLSNFKGQLFLEVLVIFRNKRQSFINISKNLLNLVTSITVVSVLVGTSGLEVGITRVTEGIRPTVVGDAGFFRNVSLIKKDNTKNISALTNLIPTVV